MKTEKNQLRHEGRPRDSGGEWDTAGLRGLWWREWTYSDETEGTSFVSPRKVSRLYPQSMEYHPNAQVRESHEKHCI